MHFTPGSTDGIYFNHNGDYSGTIWITIRDDAVVPLERNPLVERQEPGILIQGATTVRIPFDDLKQLFAGYVRGQKISALEDAKFDELLELQR